MIKLLKTYRMMIAAVGVFFSLLAYSYSMHELNNKRFKEITRLKEEIEKARVVKAFEVSWLEFERDTVEAEKQLISKKLKATLKVDKTDKEVRVIDGVYSF